MSTVYTVEIIDLQEESKDAEDFLYDMRSILKHNYELYVKKVTKEKDIYCGTCKHNDNGKCLEFDELVDKASNTCCIYEE